MARRPRPSLSEASAFSCPELRPIPAIIERLGRLLEAIVGRDVADQAFQRAASALIGRDELKRYSSWSYALSQQSEQVLASWPIGRRLYELRQYAYLGVVVIPCKPYRRGQALAALIRDVERLLLEAPPSWGLEEAAKTLAMAKGRTALNKGQPVDVGALALLGDVKPTHIRNMMVKGRAKLQRSRSDREKVDAKSALKWLATRSSFHPSNFRG